MRQPLETFTFIYQAGNSGELPKAFQIKASSMRKASESATKQVGKLGLHGLYISEHAQFGYGDWYVVCNMGVNATYAVKQVS